jgi:hypothetical protein
VLIIKSNATYELTPGLKTCKLITENRCSRLLYAQHIDGAGKQFFEGTCRRDLEGTLFSPDDAFLASIDFPRPSSINLGIHGDVLSLL